MDAITYSDARANLAATLERVCDNNEPVIITRHKARPVVIMSLEDYNSIVETACLLSNPANRAHLLASIASDQAGNTQQHDLIEV